MLTGRDHAAAGTLLNTRDRRLLPNLIDRYARKLVTLTKVCQSGGFSRAFSHVVLFQINYLEEITQLSRGTVARYGQDVMTGAFCIVQKIVWNHVLDVDCVYCCYRLIFP